MPAGYRSASRLSIGLASWNSIRQSCFLYRLSIHHVANSPARLNVGLSLAHLQTVGKVRGKFGSGKRTCGKDGSFKGMETHDVTLTKDEGPSVWLLGDLYTFKHMGEALSVTELTAFPQNGPPPHVHLRENESFWVLDGEFSVLLGERTLKAGPETFVHIPKGTLHTYKNVGNTPGRTIVLLTPGGFERLWQELGVPATQLTTPPPADPGVIEKLIALAPKYHLQIPPPPR